MKRISYNSLAVALLALAGVGVFAGFALATPIPNGAILYPRTFNDCPITALATINAYPALVEFRESNLICVAGQNMHIWNFSNDAGASSAVYGNPDGFVVNATLELIKGSAVPIEGGLVISPWWAPNTDGYFNVRLPDGEIACFGGVLPFYSFSGPPHNLRYQGGRIRLAAVYRPNCLTEADPGTMEYIVETAAGAYSSGPLAMGCNVAEEPLHGCWGIRDNVRVGGRVANLMFAGGPGAPADANVGSFFDIFFDSIDKDCPVPTLPITWGRMKATYR